MKIMPTRLEEQINRVDRTTALGIGIASALTALWSAYRLIWLHGSDILQRWLDAGCVGLPARAVGRGRCRRDRCSGRLPGPIRKEHRKLTSPHADPAWRSSRGGRVPGRNRQMTGSTGAGGAVGPGGTGPGKCSVGPPIPAPGAGGAAGVASADNAEGAGGVWGPGAGPVTGGCAVRSAAQLACN